MKSTSGTKKAYRTKKERKMERAFLALVSTGFFLTDPLCASTITPATNHGAGYTTSVAESGGVYTVTPGSGMFNNGNAFNRFEKFTLDQGHIANMKFENGGQTADTLFNFVRDRIDVNGTVNALKGGTIGGHLLFISPKGMTVGASGVINAGRFTGIAADEDFFKDFISLEQPWGSSNFRNLEAGLIPLNREGTITVQGKIHAPGGIRLAASDIDVKAGAELDTVTLDFSNLVNATAANNTVLDWGVANADMTLTRSGSGDIELRAIGTTTGSVFDTVKKDSASADITVAGTVRSFGSTSLRATASNGVYDQASSMTKSADSFSGGVSYADVKSRVNVASTAKIISSGDVTISSEALTLVDGTTTETVVNYALEIVGMLSPFDLDAAVAVISSDASVTLDGAVTAEKSLDVSAKSSVEVAKGAEATMINMIAYDQKGLGNVPALAATVGVADSAASVKIGSAAKLSAGGNLSILSESDLTAKMNSNASPYQVNGETQLTVAATVTQLTSKSNLDVADGASLTTPGALSLKSVQSGSVSTSASAGASNKSPGSVSVNVSLLDTDARVNVKSSIGSGDVKPSSLTIQADNSLSKWTATASSNSGTQNSSFAQAKGQAKANIIGSMFELLQSKTGAWGAQAFDMSKENMAKAFQVGGSLTVVYGGQTSSVNLAEGKALKAGGDVVIQAGTTLVDHLWKAQAQAGAGSTAPDQTSFGLGLLWAQPTISSDLTLEKNASVTSDSGAVTLNSASVVSYTRVAAMIEEIQKSWDALTDIFKESTTAAAKWALATEQWETTKANFASLSGQDLSFSDGFYKLVESFCSLGSTVADVISAAKTEIVDDRIKAITNMGDSALAFLDMTNYANTSARSLAASGSEATKKLGLAAALNVNLIDVTSSVQIKQGASLSAKSAVSVSSRTQNDNVAFGGNIGTLSGIPFPVMTDGTGIGGTVIVQNLNSSNALDLHQGSSVTVTSADGAIALSADESSLGVGAALSAGISGEMGVEGQVSVLTSDVTNLLRVDDQVKLEAYKITIQAANRDIAQNVSGAIGLSNGKSIGIAVAVNALSYQTQAKIADFDALFSDDVSPDVKGILKVQDFTLSASGTSNVNAIALAAEVATSKGDPDEKHWYSGLASIPGKINSKMVDISKKIADKIKPAAAGQDAGDVIELVEMGGDAIGEEVGAHDDDGELEVADDVADGGHDLDQHNADPNNANAGSDLKLSIAGSAAWNSLTYTVEAGLDGVTLKAFNASAPRSADITAGNNKWNGAFAGGVAISLAKGQQDSSVGVAGALSVNDVDSSVASAVKNSLWQSSGSGAADSLTIQSATGGQTVAAGVAVAVSSGNKTSVGADAGVSVNLLSNDVSATLDGVSQDIAGGNRALSLGLEAHAYDVQVTGGVNLGISLGEGSKVAVGAAVEVARLHNSVTAGIKNSVMGSLGDLSLSALDKITQVTAGLTVSASSTQGGGFSLAYAGAFAVNKIDNSLESFIENSTLKAGGAVLLQAKDTDGTKGGSIALVLSDDFGGNKKAIDGIIDSTGESYTRSIDLETENYYSGDRSGDTTTLAQTMNNRRSLIVTAAAAGAGSGKAAVGTAAAVSLVDNTHGTRITSADLTANSLTMDSSSGAQVIGVAAGTAVGTRGYSVNGSVVWSQVKNSATNQISGSGTARSKVSAAGLTMSADNDALTVGVAGQIGVADKTAVGLSFVYGNVQNDAENTLQSADLSASAAGKVSVSGSSGANLWNVAGGGMVGNNAVVGSVALSRVKGSTGVTLSGASLAGFKDVILSASDTSKAHTLTGTITAAFANAGVGGALSYAQVGQSDSLKLSMTDSSVTLAGGGTLTVTGTDRSEIDTLAAGISTGVTKFAFQGSVAVNLMKRGNQLTLSGTNVSAEGGDVSMTLDDASEVNSIAAILSANFGNAAAGAAVSVNRLEANNVLEVSGDSKVKAKNALFKSKSAMKIFNIGAGGAVASKAAVQGSVAVNILSGTTAARFVGSSADLDGSMGLVAQSDSGISNYLGGLTGAGTAAVGVNTGVNVLGDSTEAVVRNSTVSARGNGASVNVASSVSDDAIFKYNLADGFLPGKLEQSRVTSSYRGLTVDGSATHSVVSNLLIAGFAGTADVLTSVNVSVLSGATKALIENSALNAPAAGGDVNLRAADYTNLSANLMKVGGSGTVDVAPMVDVNTVTRTVESTLSGLSSDHRSSVYASGLSVTADSKLGAVSLVAGAGGSGAVAVGGSVSVATLKGSTLAQIKNVNAEARSLTLESSNFHRIGFVTGSVAASQYAGVGVAVGVLNQRSTVGALMIDSALDMTSDRSGAVVVSADNRLEGYTAAASIGAALYAGVAPTVSVNNMTNAVTAAVRGSTIGSDSVRAASVTVASRNASDVLMITGAVGGGIAGVGVNVNVNHFYNSTQTEISGSRIYSGGSVNFTADEIRSADQEAYNLNVGGVTVGANVLVTTFGKAGDAYSDSNYQSDIKSSTDEVTEAFGLADQYLNGSQGVPVVTVGKASALSADEQKSIADGQKGETVKHASDKTTELSVIVQNSTVSAASGDLAAKAAESGKILARSGGGSISGASASATVGINNLDRKAKVLVSGSTLTSGGALSLTSALNGVSELNAYQGSLGGLTVAAVYSGLNVTNDSSVIVNEGSVLSAGGDMTLSALDAASNGQNAYGLESGVVTAGALVSRLDVSGTIETELSGSELSAGKTLTVKTARTGSNATSIYIGSVAYNAAGSGADARAADSTKVAVTVGSGDAAVTLRGTSLDVTAQENSTMKAETKNLNVALIGASVGVALSEVKSTGSVTVTGGAKNVYDAASMSFTSLVGAYDGTGRALGTVAHGYGGALGFEYAYNRAETINKVTSTLNLLGGTFLGNPALSARALNYLNLTADVDSVTVGIVAMGNNKAMIESAGGASASLTNAAAQQVGSLALEAKTSVTDAAKSNGDGGGILVWSPSGDAGGLAAWTIVDIESNAAASLGGTWNASRDVSVTAVQNFSNTPTADATKGSVVGASATKLQNTLKGTTAAAVQNNAVVTAGGTLSITADNKVADGKSDGYVMSGNGYGGIAASFGTTESELSFTASADVGASAKLTSAGALTVASGASGTVAEKSRVLSAGLIAGSGATASLKVTYDNSVSIGYGAALRVTGPTAALILSANDASSVSAQALGDLQGAAAGGATSDMTVKVTRGNAVTVDLGSTLLSAGDVKIYAGKDEDGSSASLNYSAISHAYAHGAITGASAELDSSIDQKNVITLAGAAKAVGDVELSAVQGFMQVVESVERYAWYSQASSAQVVTTALGDAIKSLTSSNRIDLTGSVEAGQNNKYELTISGTVLLGEYAEGGIKVPTASGDMVVSSDTALVTSPKLEGSSGEVAVTTRSMDYSTNLYERWKTVCQLMQDYQATSGDVTSSAYLGFAAEKQQLEAEMKSLHIAETNASGDIIGVSRLIVQCVEVGEVNVSGGNIVVDADSLSGAGSLTAHGAPQITITNASNLYLVLDGLNVEKEGGEIRYNNVAVTNLAELNNVETNGTKTAGSFSGGVSADKGTGSSAITVTNSWSSSAPKIYDVNSSDLSQDLFVLPDISVQGSVINKVGDVTLKTDQGSIVTNKATVYAAGTLTLDAANGAISQYSDGMISIGAKPEDAYSSLVSTANDELKKRDKNTNESVVLSYDAGVGSGSSAEGSAYVAGGNIFLTADTINVNGLIQSGFGSYTLELTDSLAGKIAQLDAQWVAAGSPTLSDSNLGSAYTLVEGGKVWDSSKGYYDYAPGCKYNPSTQSVIVDSITAGGGSVYLTGRVINTAASSGNAGKIVVFKGAAEASLSSSLSSANSHSVTFQISAVDLGSRAGQVIVTDVAKKGLTTSFDASGTYTPEEGLRYNWTAGSENSKATKYTESQGFTVWGLFDWGDETKTQYSSTDVSLHDAAMKSGDYVTSLDAMHVKNYSQYESKGLVVLYDNVVGSSVSTDWTSWKEYDNWTHFTGTAYRSRIVTTESQSSMVYSVKADNPISVQVVSSANPDKISITASGAVALGGAVKNSSSAGTTVITGGSVESLAAGSLLSDHVTLVGTDGVGTARAIEIRSIGGTSEVTLNSAGGTAAIDVVNGALKLDATAKIAVDASAYGNITGSAEARRVDLNSDTGAIGSSATAFQVKAGQLGDVQSTNSLAASFNASAAGDIYAEQTAGDLRVGSVISKGGDVTLTASAGSIQNANPYAGQSCLGEKTLTELWTSLGLTDSEGNSLGDERQAGDIANLENSIKGQYSYFKQLDQTLTDEQKAKDTVYQGLNRTFGSVEDIDAYIAQQKTTEGTDLYTLANSEAYGWTREALLYAIQDAIVNPQSVSVELGSAVQGKNVMLNAVNSIGSVAPSTEIDLKDQSKLKENLQTLSLANPYDVTFNGDGTCTVTLHRPVSLTASQVTADTTGSPLGTSGDIFISSPADLSIDHVISAQSGDLRLMANGSVRLLDENSVVRGGSLIVTGGQDVGSEALPFYVNISGLVSANAGQDLFLIDREGDTYLGAVAAGRKAVISSDSSILMSPEADDAAYVAAPAIYLTASGDVGSSDAPLRVVTRESSGDIGLIVSADGAIHVKGMVSAKGEALYVSSLKAGADKDISVSADGAVRVSCALETPQGNLSVTASGDLVLEKSLSSGKTLTAGSTGGVLTVSDDLVSSGDMGLFGGAGVKLTEDVWSDAKLQIDSAWGTVSTSKSLYSSGDMIVSGDGGVEIAGRLLTGSKLEMHSARGVIHTSGDVDAGTGIRAFGTGGLILGGDVSTPGAMELRSDGGTVSTAGNVEASGDMIVSGDSGVNLGGHVWTGGVLDLDSTSGMVIVSGDSVASKGKMTVDGAKGVELNGVVAASSALDLSSSAGMVSTNGDVDALGDITVDGYGGVSLGGEVSTPKAMKLTSARGIVATVGNIESSGDMIVSGDGGVNLGGHVFTEGALDLDSLSGKVIVSGDYVASEGKMTVDGAEGVELNGVVLALSTLDLSSSAGEVSTGGSIVSTENMTLSGAAGVKVGGSVLALRNLDMSSSAGVVSTNGDVDALGDITVDGDGGVSLGGEVSTPKSMTLTSEHGIVATVGNIESSGDMVVSGDGGVNLGGHVFTEGALDLDSLSGKVIVSGDYVASEGKMTVDGAEGVELNGVVLALSTLDLSSSAGEVSTGGSIVSTENMTLSGAAGVKVGGSVLALRNLDMSSSAGVVSTNGDVDALGDITVDGDGGVSLGGEVSTPKSMTLTSEHGIVATVGNIESSGDMVVSGDGGVNLGGHVWTGGLLDLDSAGGMVIVSGDFVASEKEMTLDGALGVELNGAAVAGSTLDIASSRGAVRSRGSLLSNGNLTVKGAGGVDLGGAELTYGDLTLESSGGAVVTGLSTLASGDVSISGDQGVELGGHVLAGGRMNLTSSRGAVVTAGMVDSTGDLTVWGRRGVSLGGQAVTQGAMHLNSDEGMVTTSGHLIAAGTVMTVRGYSGVDLGGLIAAGDSLTLHSDDGITAANGVISAPVITLRGKRGVNFGEGAIVSAPQSALLDTEASMDLRGILYTPDLSVTAGGTVFQSLGFIDSPHVKVMGGTVLLNAERNRFDDLYIDAAGGTAAVRGASSLKLRYSERVLDLAVRMGGDVLFVDEPVTLNSLYASAGGDLTVGAARIGNVVTAGSATLLAGGTLRVGDVTAGGDLRLHGDAGLYAGDLESGRDAWLFGLGDGPSVLSFGNLTAARDGAVILKSGYISGGRVLVGRDGALGVKWFSGPREEAPTLASSGAWVYYPYGGMVLPRDPFSVNFDELLSNRKMEEMSAAGGREQVKVWDGEAVGVTEKGQRTGFRQAVESVIRLAENLKRSLEKFWYDPEFWGAQRTDDGVDFDLDESRGESGKRTKTSARGRAR